jgi:Ran-binding protein 1
MRQEKTMKIIANHYLDPRCKLEPMTGNDKSLAWGAFDFSDGKSLVDTTFAIRFKTTEIANNEFKTAFLDAQKENAALAAGLDSKEGATEADAAADAIASLNVAGAESALATEA